MDLVYINAYTKVYQNSSICSFRVHVCSSKHQSNLPIVYRFMSLLYGFLDDLLNIDNTYFYGIVKQIYLSELQLNNANSSDTEAPFPDLHLTILDGFVSSKIYDKRDDFDFDILHFPFLYGDIPHATFYGVYFVC